MLVRVKIIVQKTSDQKQDGAKQKSTKLNNNKLNNNKEATKGKPEVSTVQSDSEVSITFNRDVNGDSLEEGKFSIKTDDACILPAHPEDNTEAYAPIQENMYQSVLQNPLSTFSIDVDTASYSNIRRFLMDGQLPQEMQLELKKWLIIFHITIKDQKVENPLQ